MPELNPYEAPQSDLQTADEIRPPTKSNSALGSGAFVRTLIVQFMLILSWIRVAWVSWASDAELSRDAKFYAGLTTISAIVALVQAYRRARSGWAVFEALLLTALLTLLLCLSGFSR